MARIGILDIHQLPSSRPARYVKRSVGDLLVRRLLAKRVAKDLIQMVAIHAALRGVDIGPRAYIPETLPPAEGHGLKFVPPLQRETGYSGRMDNLPSGRRFLVRYARQFVQDQVNS